jgi:hypothetical protein
MKFAIYINGKFIELFAIYINGKYLKTFSIYISSKSSGGRRI